MKDSIPTLSVITLLHAQPLHGTDACFAKDTPIVREIKHVAQLLFLQTNQDIPGDGSFIRQPFMYPTYDFIFLT